MKNGLRTAVSIIAIVMLYATVIIEIALFESLRQIIFCSFVVLLTGIILFVDNTLEYAEGIVMHTCFYALWFICFCAFIFFA